MFAIPGASRVLTRHAINTEKACAARLLSKNIGEQQCSSENSDTIKIPLDKREVVIVSPRCFGEWESKIVNLPLVDGDEKVTLTIWGKYGTAVADELEKKLKFKFDSLSRSFIENIGNLNINHFEIIIGGNKYKDCFTETDEIGLLEKNPPLKGVKILDIGGLSYLLFQNGSINAYDSFDISPDNEVMTYTSLSDLVEKKVKDCERFPTN